MESFATEKGANCQSNFGCYTYHVKFADNSLFSITLASRLLRIDNK
jgi:hypothetical protein